MPLDMKGLRRMSRQLVEAISKVPVAKREDWMSNMLTSAIDIRYGKVQELDKKGKIDETLEGLEKLAKPDKPREEKPK